jgi:hypothetical protein
VELTVTSDHSRDGDIDALVAALTGREITVLAPNSTVNTGLVTGGQRLIASSTPEGGATTTPMRQGPVRAQHLNTARRRFVPPPGFQDALAALGTGVVVLLGEPGTGRETHALNLLAHGIEEPVLIQVDGAVNLSRWVPRPQGVHGYLVMEPPDPFSLRAWDLSRLEALLAEAGARLVIVLADAPGMVGTLEDHLGLPVVRHQPPDPRAVFTAHLSDGCSGDEAVARWLRAKEPLDELLPEGLPPRHAAQAAAALLRLGATGATSGAEVMRHLVRAEGPEIVARAQKDPVLLAHLLSLCVYGGLHRSVVTERAAELVRLIQHGGEPDLAAQSRHAAGVSRQRSLSEILRLLGAQRVEPSGEETTDRVSFYWPAMSEAVWEVLCREHTDLLPLLHIWLADPRDEADQIERAGRALSAMAEATGGRSLELLGNLASAPSFLAPQVAAWCLGTAVQCPVTAQAAGDLLEEWSGAAEAPLRKVVAYACSPDHGQVGDDRALRLLYQLMDTLADPTDGLFVIAAALVQRFETGDATARATVLTRMRDWTQSDGVPSLLTALAFPVMASTHLAWWSDRLLEDTELASLTVQLTGHALTDSCAFVAMRDVLLAWCAEADESAHRARALSELLDGLVAARQPGFLRWLLAIDRGPDTMPGKEPAARALAMWRSNIPASNID